MTPRRRPTAVKPKGGKPVRAQATSALRLRESAARTFERVTDALADAGLVFGAPEAALDEAAAAVMGPRRFARHQAALAAYVDGRADARALYATLRDVREAVLFQSHDAVVAAAAATHVFLSALQDAAPKARVVELGAFSGVMTAAWAELRPDLRYGAFDRHRPLISAAAEMYGRRNIKFEAASYSVLARRPVSRAEAAAVVVSVFGINADFVEAPYSLRSLLDVEAPLHKQAKSEARDLFRAARRRASDDALSVHVLRAPRIARAFAYLDAATEAGFAFDADKSKRFMVGDQPFLLLALRVAPVKAAASAETFRSFWIRDTPPPDAAPGDFFDDDAVLMYESLIDRRPIRSRATAARAGTAATRREFGSARGFRYELVLGSDGTHALRLGSAIPSGRRSVRPGRS